MKPKYRRLLVLLSGLAVMGTGLSLVLREFQDNLLYYYAPSVLPEKLAAGEISAGQSFRIGGLVMEGTVHAEDGGRATCFTLTDYEAEIPVCFTGVLPPLFRPGQGIIAEGSWDSTHSRVQATNLLTKHDENYMPPELRDTLKKAPHDEKPAGR